jgi:cystathionine beta-lyase/cystathionine gamma-synthase
MSTEANRKPGVSTRILHSGYSPSEDNGAVIPPLHLSTTFQMGNTGGYDYSRSGNPTREILERTLAELENADFALAFSSGSAALANVVALLHPGEEILFSADAYGGTYRYIADVYGKKGGTHHISDLTDIVQTEKILAAENVKIVWVETPTNPLLRVTDIAALADIVHKHGAILVVDNTFATPIVQKPLDLGADVVAYSTTKYINGHSDSVGGALITRDEKLYELLKYSQNATGSMLSPFDSWLTLRGLRTLELRVQRHVKSARQIADMLQRHPKVSKVYYPGLFDGSQGEIVAKQMALPGGMVSMEIDAKYDVQTFIGALKYFPLAESLGGVESLIDHPASMTHASIPAVEREKIGLSDGLLRLSIGIENAEDLLADLMQALDKLA